MNGAYTIIVVLCAFCVDVAFSQVKVLLLVGQSNMVGMGSVDHLKILVNSSKHNEYRNDLWNGNGFKERSDVFITYNGRKGNLTVGYGADKDRLGPELGFGWEVGDSLKQDIVIIKAAWGGRSLAVDFRPPRSGEGSYEGVKPSTYGWEYRAMIETFANGIEDLPNLYPRYDKSKGYSFGGFVWFQGWNDMLSWPCVNEYGFNLANLIRDVRSELDEPNLPLIVGELGMHGNLTEQQGLWVARVQRLRDMQRGVTLMKEFRNSSAYVRTFPYVVANGTAYNKQYHYYGRADTYYHIGKALGRAAIQLLQGFEGKQRTSPPDPIKYRAPRPRRDYELQMLAAKEIKSHTSAGVFSKLRPLPRSRSTFSSGDDTFNNNRD